MQQHTEVVETTPTPLATTPVAAAARTTSINYDPYAGRRASAARIVQAVYLVFGAIEALIVLRCVLRALGANADAGFAQLAP